VEGGRNLRRALCVGVSEVWAWASQNTCHLIFRQKCRTSARKDARFTLGVGEKDRPLFNTAISAGVRGVEERFTTALPAGAGGTSRVGGGVSMESMR
jgi:hypothetical protein